MVGRIAMKFIAPAAFILYNNSLDGSHVRYGGV